jgi:signal transduction histidine kinase
MDKSNKREKKRNYFRGFSIQRRLPLLICVLLLSVMITFGLISYFTVRKTMLETGKESLLSRSDQLSSMFSQTTQNLISTTHAMTIQDPIKKFLQPGKKDTLDELEQVSNKLKQDTASVLVQLLSKDFKPLFYSGKNGIEKRINFDSILAPSNVDSVKIGKLYVINDSMYYPIVAAVNDKDNVIGYIVRWRMVTYNARSIRTVSMLLGIGEDSKLYFGNKDNSVWTDMLKPIASPLPPGTTLDSNIYQYKMAGGPAVIAAVKPIRNTPWVVIVEVPKQTMLQPAKRFLGSVILIGSILTGIGIFIAWSMSRNITRPLNKLTAAASTIAGGDYSIKVEVDRRDEVGKLARAFNAMTVELNKAKEELEKKVIEGEQMNEQLRNLSAHLQNIREEERIHIAREMHDELGQFLTGLKMDIAWLNKRSPAGTENAAMREKLSEMTALVDDAVVFVRKLAAELRPSILDDLGLIPALEWHSQEFQRRFNVEVEFRSPIKELQPPELIATGLFRMYQESLTNVGRHAEAKKVVAVFQVADGMIHLSVRDDGKGFDMNGTGKRKTLGLLGMKERAVMIGGQLEIRSEPGKGTLVFISVPLHQEVIA